ncbi:hypothetical protein [Kineococcus rhizosphaerae]|uniref:Polyketide cyclase/dehydrase/lipid transport protein n=1 Tax=Kineococcus rhizosphaerae TaxID=559628 RepID=A0A2T0R126_9ACTN|nr:hypothetical protein [Kineococcus rhizosphaerae]PRY13022.1 hypothetical protein CLV37_109212 [Kineococcus rhizosphaerae]
MHISAAKDLATKAAAAAGNVVLRHGGPSGPRQQTLTVTRPVENVLRACQDADVLAAVVGPAGGVVRQDPDRFTWHLAGRTVVTDLVAEPNRVVFRTAGPEPAEALVVEAWPAPREGGAEVVVRLDLPLAGELGEGAAAFTFAYRLRALLQTGEVPTLGDVPSGRSGQNSGEER